MWPGQQNAPPEVKGEAFWEIGMEQLDAARRLVHLFITKALSICPAPSSDPKLYEQDRCQLEQIAVKEVEVLGT